MNIILTIGAVLAGLLVLGGIIWFVAAKMIFKQQEKMMSDRKKRFERFFDED